MSTVLVEQTAWPQAVFQHDNCFPVSFWDYGINPRSPWPANPLKPAFGYQKFIDWALSFLLQRLRTTAGIKVGLKKRLSPEAMRALQSPDDLAIIELDSSEPGGIRDWIDFLQHPNVQGDFFSALQMAFQRVREIIGLYPITQGISSGSAERSAMAADIKYEAARIPIEARADGVADCFSVASRKEGMLALSSISENTVEIDGVRILGMDVFGEVAKTLWSQRPDNPAQIAAEYDFEIEAGGGRKKDKAWEIEKADSLFASINQALGAVADIVDPNSRLEVINKALKLVLIARDVPGSEIPELLPIQQQPGMAMQQPQASIANTAELAMERVPVAMKDGDVIFG
jgi:hypothetical protein